MNISKTISNKVKSFIKNRKSDCNKKSRPQYEFSHIMTAEKEFIDNVYTAILLNFYFTPKEIYALQGDLRLTMKRLNDTESMNAWEKDKLHDNYVGSFVKMIDINFYNFLSISEFKKRQMITLWFAQEEVMKNFSKDESIVLFIKNFIMIKEGKGYLIDPSLSKKDNFLLNCKLVCEENPDSFLKSIDTNVPDSYINRKVNLDKRGTSLIDQCVNVLGERLREKAILASLVGYDMLSKGGDLDQVYENVGKAIKQALEKQDSIF